MATAKMASFSTRLEIRGENAKRIREILDAKMLKDNRKTYTNAIEALILEYGNMIDDATSFVPKSASKKNP